jgi:hypothetical protein
MAGQWASETVDGIRIDVMLTTMIRHHVTTEQEFADVLEFMKMPCDVKHFDILFRNMGRRLPLAVSWLNVERQRGDTIMRGNMHFGPELYWSNGQLIVGARMPEAVLMALEGRLMTEIVDHPYMPRTLRIASMRQERTSSRWVARPVA